MLGLSERVYGLGKDIHHVVCRNGGERWFGGAPVDGYDPPTRTVLNTTAVIGIARCRRYFPNGQDKIVSHDQTRGD